MNFEDKAKINDLNAVIIKIIKIPIISSSPKI